MLVKIIPDYIVINKMQQRAKEIVEEGLDSDGFFEKIMNEGNYFGYHMKPINSFDEFKDAPDGLYLDITHILKVSEFLNARNRFVEEFPTLTIVVGDDKLGEERTSYGLCHNYQQVLNHYPELNESNREFVILFALNWKQGMEFDYNYYYDKFSGEILSGDKEITDAEFVMEYQLYEFVHETREQMYKRLYTTMDD